VTTMDNVLDWIEQRLAAADASDEMVAAVPYRPNGRADAYVLVKHRGWESTPTGRRALDHLVDTGECRSVGRQWNQILLRFDNSALEDLAARLEEGAADPLRTRDLRRDRRWLVNFIDPNTTKALHIGHLRNICVGQSLASVADAGGVTVTRQVRVGDAGRSMGEAMAGYLAFGEGQTPESSGIKGDHLVGDCYSRFVAGLGPQPETPVADAQLTREAHVTTDVADELFARWRDGDAEVVRLFHDVRRWVIDGHYATYARLGVEVDRMLFESHHLEHAEEIVDLGLERGFLRRAESGAVMYDTGDPEYERILLVRSDGFPTQNLRYLATWSGTRHLYSRTRTLNIGGIEWSFLLKYLPGILAELHPPEERHPHRDITHEMVVSDSGVIKSSKRGALLIDDILDKITNCEAMTELCRSHGRVTPEEVAPIVAMGRFLADPLHRRITVRPDAFRSDGPGWQLARAWVAAWDPAHDGPTNLDLDDADYRSLVVRSSLHRRLLANAIDQEEVLPLVQFHLHQARWFCETSRASSLARVMRSVLGEGLVALGLHATVAPSAIAEKADLVS
jgi:tRNA synthetases class I (R)